MNGTTVADDVARARALGITLRASDAADRAADPLPASWPRVDSPTVRVNGPTVTRPTVERVSGRRPFGMPACPTCNDGILTIAHPVRCRECVRAGL